MSPDIDSPGNDRIKNLARLLERRHRDATGTFLIEGRREVARAIAADIEIIESYLCPDLGAPGMGDNIVTVSRRVFAKLSRRQHPDGILVVARQWPTNLAAVALSAAPLLLVAESIEKPGNLGAMLRTAEAAGLDAVVVCDPIVDVFNPNVVRASQGALFTVQVAAAASADVVSWLASNDIAAVTTYPDAAVTYTAVDLTGPSAVVVGAESTGLTEGWRRLGTAVSIPMAGAGDSLNAATTAAIVAFEAVRQRSL